MSQIRNHNDTEQSVARTLFIDVGQGDCTIVIDNVTSRALLVDCPSASVDKVYDVLSEQSVTLDTLIVTHWDLDHYGGIARILEFAPAASVYYNIQFWKLNNKNGRLRSALKQITSRDNGHDLLRNAEVPAKGEIGTSVRWQLLAPTHAEITQSTLHGNRNASSVVVDVNAGPHRIVIGGDATTEIWQRLLDTHGSALQADILRWPHHGALLGHHGEVGHRLLGAVSPQCVIVSVGTRNTYGHPHKTSISAASAAARVLCTQLGNQCHANMPRDRPTPCAGTITANSGDGALQIHPQRHDHNHFLDGLAHPMCRQHDPPTTADR